MIKSKKSNIFIVLTAFITSVGLMCIYLLVAHNERFHPFLFDGCIYLIKAIFYYFFVPAIFLLSFSSITFLVPIVIAACGFVPYFMLRKDKNFSTIAKYLSITISWFVWAFINYFAFEAIASV